MGGSHVVHRGVVADSAMTWPTRQLLCYLEMVWGFFLVRMLWGYIGTNFPRTVYYYGLEVGK